MELQQRMICGICDVCSENLLVILLRYCEGNEEHCYFVGFQFMTILILF